MPVFVLRTILNDCNWQFSPFACVAHSWEHRTTFSGTERDMIWTLKPWKELSSLVCCRLWLSQWCKQGVLKWFYHNWPFYHNDWICFLHRIARVFQIWPGVKVNYFQWNCVFFLLQLKSMCYSKKIVHPLNFRWRVIQCFLVMHEYIVHTTIYHKHIW